MGKYIKTRTKAKKVDRISFEEMLEMASLGSKVLQIRSVEFAGKYQVPLRVLSSFDNDDDGAFDENFKQNVEKVTRLNKQLQLVHFLSKI